MRALPPFRPLPLLGNRHLQTVLAAQVNLGSAPPSTTHLLQLPDGDRLALEISTPKNWQPHASTVVLVHGLCGCHASPYMIRIIKKWGRI